MKENFLSFFKRCLTLFLAVFYLNTNAQTLPGTYITTWAGNSIVPTANDDNVVQGWANSMFVETDGTVYANSNWDEAARELGIYKNGLCTGLIPNQHESADGAAITANATYIWASVEAGSIRRFNKSAWAVNGSDIVINTYNEANLQPVRGLAASATELFVSDYPNNQIKVYNASTQTLARSWTVTRPGPLALDAAGNIWALTYDSNPWGTGTGACIKAYSSTGSLLKTVTLSAGVKARSITIDKTNNELLVTDISNNMQIQIYNNINGTPAFIQSFGTQGGILSGTKGLVAPLKFNVPCLVGVDASHNIIVWSNGNSPDMAKNVGGEFFDNDGMGSSVESYTRAGVRNWQMLGLEFVDMGTFDPATDGADLYTKHEHITMDYTKPDGQQWTWKGWTLDRTTYPNDTRMFNDGGHLAPTIMRRVQGSLFMYMTNMTADGWWIYRFDNTNQGEIAIPCGTVSSYENLWVDANGNGQKEAGESSTPLNITTDNNWGRNIDKNGTVWFANTTTGIRNFPVQSINSFGVPVYSSNPAQTVATPAPFNDLRRISYDATNDVMYLSGYTAAKPNSDGDWGVAGRVLAKYPNWSTGNRTAAFTIDLPWITPGPAETAVSFAIEGSYIFVCGVTSRGKVWVYNTSNGALAGNLIPGANVGGLAKTGWCDLRNSIEAFKKMNGEYLITVEEDGWEKILIYKWNPGTPVVNAPTVTTTVVSSITTTTATSGGNVINGGSASVTARGVCWSTSANPTTALTTKTINGSGTGTFTSAITGLTPGTLYHVRAYATNSVGTSYGSDLTFTTSSGGGSASLTGSVSINTNAVNLTSVGTGDWKHFRSNVRKASGTNSISNPTIIGGTAINYTDDARTFSWTGGTPTATGTNVATGKYIEGNGKGFSFTAPAGNGTNTLYVYVGGYNSGGTLTAHLSNSAASDYVNTVSAQVNEYDVVYTITYNAAQAGQNISITWVQASDAGSGNVTIQAAALVGTASRPTPAAIAVEATPKNVIEIYPNPAVNFTTINFKTMLKGEPAIIEVTDLSGRRVFSSAKLGGVSFYKLNTGNYAAGTYIISVMQGKEKTNHKLVIK